MFENLVLKSGEEKNYLFRISDNKRSRKQFYENEVNFGKIYFLSDLNEDLEKCIACTRNVNMWNMHSTCTRTILRLTDHT